MITRKTIFSILLAGGVVLQAGQVAYADVTIDGQVYTDEWVAAHPTEVANYISQNPENAAAIAAAASASTQAVIYNAYQRSTGSTISLTEAQNWASQTASRGGATMVTIGNQSYSNEWIAAHPQEVADYLKQNPSVAANVLKNASQSTINVVLAAYNNVNKTNTTTQQAKDWINQNAGNSTSNVPLKNPVGAPMTITAIYSIPRNVNYSGGSGIYTPQGQEISKQQIADFFNSNPTNEEIANYALKVGLNQYQVANAIAQWQGLTYNAPVWVPNAAATIGGSAGGASQVGLTTATAGTGAWGSGACAGAGWGGSAWSGDTGFGGYDTCRNGSNMGSYGGNTSGNNSSNSTVIGIDGKKYTCIPGRAFTAVSVVTDGVTSGFCTVVSSTGGVTGGTTGGSVGTGGSTGSVPRYTVNSDGTANTAGNSGYTTNSTLLSDLDPTGSSSSCVELTSTALRYQAKDANTNGEVTTLQTFLNDNSYLPTAPTGFFGAGTLKAVKAFQSANGINPTGFVGPNTRAVIKTVSCSSVGSGSATIPDNYSPVTTALPAGCASSTGFSRTTGLSCASSFPAGCDSASGYSVTTGVKCSQ